MAKLSDREKAAKKVGVAVNYSKSASLQKPIAPVKLALPKSLASKTPAAKLMTAQKSQPMFKPLAKGQYGPSAPTDYGRFKNAEANYNTAIKNISDMQRQSAILSQVRSTGEKQLNLKKAQDEEKEAQKKTKFSSLLNSVGSTITKGIAKVATAPKTADAYIQRKLGRTEQADRTIAVRDQQRELISGGLKLAAKTPQFIAQGGMTTFQSFKEGLTGKKSEYTPKSELDKVVFGTDKPIISTQTRVKRGTEMAKSYAESKGINLSRGQSAFAGGLLGVGGVLGDALPGPGKAFGKALSQGAKQAIEALQRSGRTAKEIAEESARIMAADAKGTFASLGKNVADNATIRAGDNLGPKTAQAAELSDSNIARMDIGESSGTRVPNTPENAPQAPRVVKDGIPNRPPQTPDEVPRTRAELPKRNTGRAEELFEETDDLGNSKVYANESDGKGGLVKRQVGEWVDGVFTRTKGEDGRDVADVLSENQKNLREGKRVSIKDQNSGDARAAIRNMRKPGMLRGGRKLTSSADSKLYSTSEDNVLRSENKSRIAKLQEQLKNAKNPDEYERISRLLDEEVSISKDWDKLNPAAKKAQQEIYNRDNPDLPGQIADEYQGTKEAVFDAPKKGVLREAMEKKGDMSERVLRNKGRFNGSKPKDPLLQEARKYKSAEEYEKSLNLMKWGKVTGVGELPIDKLSKSQMKVLLKDGLPENGGSLKVSDFKPGRKITQPIEVSQRGSTFVVENGRHRLFQALANGDKKIPVAFKSGEGKAYSTPLTDLYNKAQGGKGMLAANATGAAGGFVNEEGEVDFSQYNAKNALIGLTAGVAGIKGAKGLLRKSDDVIRSGDKWGRTKIGDADTSEMVARERFNIPKLEKVSFGGSDRDVYDLGDGRVLKVSKNSRGLDQQVSSSDYYAEEAGLIPETIETGKNYIVKEKVGLPDANTKAMVAELKKLHNLNSGGFYNRDEHFRELDKAYGILEKYGYPSDDLRNYGDILWGDMQAIRNWGTKNGKPIMLDEGTLNGRLVSNASKNAKGNNANLQDPEFRAIYNQSRAAKKKFGDTDKKTMYAHGVGSAAGIEEDENGNLSYNIQKGLLGGLAGGIVASKGAKAIGKKGLLTVAKESRRPIPKNLALNSEAGTQVLTEMELSTAGKRNIIGSGMDAEVLAESSTFPKWVSPELRSKDLFEKVSGHIENGTVPTSSKQLALYNEVRGEMLKRAEQFPEAPKVPDGEAQNRRLQYIQNAKLEKANAPTPVTPEPKRGLFTKGNFRRPQPGETHYSKQEIKDLANEAKYKSVEDRETFKKGMDEWVAKRDVAKTTAYEVGSKIEVPKGQGPEIIKAIESGEAKDGIAAGFKQEFDRLFEEAKKAGIDIRYMKDYVTHIWKQSPLEVEKIAENAAKKGFQFSKGRSIPTYEEGIKLGLEPEFTNPNQILATYAQKLEEMKANMKFLNDMKDKGLIVDSSVGRRTGGMVEINAPGMIKSESFGPEGTKIIGSYYATPEIAEQINRVFGAVPTDKVNKFFAGAAKASSTLQDITLSGGIPKTPLNAFTFAQMTKDVLAGRVVSPFTAAIRSSFSKFDTAFQKKNIGAIKELQERNVPVNTSLTLESLGEDSFLKKAFTGGKEGKWNQVKSVWSKSMNEPTFQRFMTELQVNLYNDVKDKAMGKGFFNLRKGVGEKEAADIAAEAVKNFYGIIGSGTMARRSSLGKNITGATLFAPRYREAMINFWVNNVKAISPIHFGKGGTLGMKFNNPLSLKNQNNTKFMIGALATYAAYDYLNQKYYGNHLWENPSGKEDKLLIPGKDGYTKGIPYLSSIATIPRAIARQGMMAASGDVSGALKDAGQTYLGSLVKPLADVAANSDYFGKEIYKEADTTKDKLKKQGVYLAIAYTGHPYVKAGVSAVMAKEPTYQTVSKALEAPIRYYDSAKMSKNAGWSGFDNAAKRISKIEPGPERQAALQDYIASVPEELRQSQAGVLRDMGFETKGITLSDNIIKGKPVYERIQSLYDQGNDEAADQMYESLNDVELERYNAVRSAERAKRTTKLKELLSSDPKEAVKYVRSLREDQGDLLYENLTKKGNEEWLAKYEKGKIE